jgi:kinesin family protein 11
MITPCCGDLKELKGGHYHRIVEITENAGKCLLNEYMVRKRLSCTVSHQSICCLLDYNFECCLNCLRDMQVDEPSCSTPTRRLFNLPSVSSIEELRTPSFEELLKAFWDAKSQKLANGDVKHTGSYEATQSVRDSRVPLTTIN